MNFLLIKFHLAFSIGKNRIITPNRFKIGKEENFIVQKRTRRVRLHMQGQTYQSQNKIQTLQKLVKMCLANLLHAGARRVHGKKKHRLQILISQRSEQVQSIGTSLRWNGSCCPKDYRLVGCLVGCWLLYSLVM